MSMFYLKEFLALSAFLWKETGFGLDKRHVVLYLEIELSSSKIDTARSAMIPHQIAVVINIIVFRVFDGGSAFLPFYTLQLLHSI